MVVKNVQTNSHSSRTFFLHPDLLGSSFWQQIFFKDRGLILNYYIYCATLLMSSMTYVKYIIKGMA